MKKIFFVVTSLFLFGVVCYSLSQLLASKDYRRDSRRFFCLEKGKCITMWRTRNGICYIIPGKYAGILTPTSQGYISSTFNNKINIIWGVDSQSVIVQLENEDEQIIHQPKKGIKIINYKLNKKYNDSVFLYYDGKYQRYKSSVNFITIDIKEERAYGNDGKAF